MENFERLKDIINYLDNLESNRFENQSSDVSLAEDYLFVASRIVRMNNEFLYNIPLQKITILPLKFVKMNVAFHLFFKSTPDLLNYVTKDMGDYEISAQWGIEDQLSSPKIFSWQFGMYQVSLRKAFQSVRDYALLPAQDVLTVSTYLYDEIKNTYRK